MYKIKIYKYLPQEKKVWKKMCLSSMRPERHEGMKGKRKQNVVNLKREMR